MTTHRHAAFGPGNSAVRERSARAAMSPGPQVSACACKIFVAADDQQAELVTAALGGSERAHIHRIENVTDIALVLTRTRADAVIIVSERLGPDIIAVLHAIQAIQPLAAVLFVAHCDQDEIDAVMAAGVSALVVDGLQAHRIASVLQVALCRFRTHQALRGELEKAKSDLAARKAVERAKGILMERRGLTEPDAYALLRRSAMQDGKTVSAIAEAVIAADRLLTT